jgi:hypothetical protein
MCKQDTYCAGFEIPTAVVMKRTIFWDITPCNPLKVNRRFEGTYPLHLQGRIISRAKSQRGSKWQACHLFSRCFFDLEDVPPKRGLTFNGLHGVISEKIVLFKILTNSLTNYLINSIELSPSWESPVAELLRNFKKFYWTRRFITVFTGVRHWSVSWARWTQLILPHPISLRSILILFSHIRLGLPSGLFLSGLPIINLHALSFFPVRAIGLVPLIPLDLVVVIMFG